ncbi:hypothetical protein OOJ09_11020 [Mesorhizobium qingshengii]|uniref:Secreted protein n=1 Tax=Mesorhizobium qingshengii TaxID=1165689 RepID=A0ABT4QT14_9HYPH|nr:hypothetical protein [Mesorhizobium qingshengii]MCZ8544715.1 hypothetical protein [Mesorhizobium qingshengii]
MIKTALVAMTIVGCDCDAKLCEYIGETPAKWSTIAECEAAMKSQMLHQRNFNYPLVSGICRAKGSSSSSQLAATASRPELKPVSRVVKVESPLPPELSHRPSAPVGSPATAMDAAAARPVAYEQVVDGGTGALYRTKNGYAVVKTDLGRAVSATADMAKRSANWLAGLVPSKL